jgi:hypothetical protein
MYSSNLLLSLSIRSLSNFAVDFLISDFTSTDSWLCLLSVDVMFWRMMRDVFAL